MRPVLLLLLGAHAAFAETHTLQYFYTTTTGITNIPMFVDVGVLNGEIISIYDSTTQRKMPKQKWMAENLDQQYWDRGTERMKGTEQVFFNNLQVIMSRFNQAAGVHTVQEMYGCEWDDQTGETRGFRQYGYDGEDFLILELKEMRYISPVPQGMITVQKLNNDRALIEGIRNYFSSVCVEWLQKYLEYGNSSLKKTVSPQVSLLQKYSSSSSSPSVSCHATGFYPSEITITWMRNEEKHEDVDLGELLPNEDGTFQRTSTITVSPEELKNNKFSCEVQHQGETLTVEKFRNRNAPLPISLIIGVVAALLLLVVIGVVGFLLYRKKKAFKPKTGLDVFSVSSDSSVDSTRTLLR